MEKRKKSYSIDRVVVFTRPEDGGLSYVHPCRSVDDPEDMTDDQIFERALKDIPKNAINPTAMFFRDLPKERDYRGAWKQNAHGLVEHDITKAKDMMRQYLRQARAPKLQQLDTDYMRADEAGNAQLKKSIADQKQRLRDLTAMPEIEACETVEQLRSIWPSDLPVPEK